MNWKRLIIKVAMRLLVFAIWAGVFWAFHDGVLKLYLPSIPELGFLRSFAIMAFLFSIISITREAWHGQEKT